MLLDFWDKKMFFLGQIENFFNFTRKKMQEEMQEQCLALQTVRRDLVKLILGSEEPPKNLEKSASSYERKFNRFHEKFCNNYYDESVPQSVAAMGINEWIFGSAFNDTFRNQYKTHAMHFSELQTLVRDAIMSIDESDPTKNSEPNPKPKNTDTPTPAPKKDQKPKSDTKESTEPNFQAKMIKILKQLDLSKQKVIKNVQSHRSRPGSK